MFESVNKAPIHSSILPSVTIDSLTHTHVQCLIFQRQVAALRVAADPPARRKRRNRAAAEEEAAEAAEEAVSERGVEWCL